MSVVADRVTAACPKHPEGVHQWQVFGGGVGCALCPAWRPRTLPPLLIDPHPTTAILRPPEPAPEYGVAVSEDLSIDVMADLLEVSRSDVSFGELEALANRVIERVRAS